MTHQKMIEQGWRVHNLRNVNGKSSGTRPIQCWVKTVGGKVK